MGERTSLPTAARRCQKRERHPTKSLSRLYQFLLDDRSLKRRYRDETVPSLKHAHKLAKDPSRNTILAHLRDEKAQVWLSMIKALLKGSQGALSMPTYSALWRSRPWTSRLTRSRVDGPRLVPSKASWAEIPPIYFRQEYEASGVLGVGAEALLRYQKTQRARSL